MSRSAWILIGLALLVDGGLAVALVGRGGDGRMVFVAAPAGGGRPGEGGPVEAAVLTADDVARGVWALAGADGPVALRPEQRSGIGEALAAGERARKRVGELRTRHRAERAAAVETGREIAARLPARGAAMPGAGR